MMIKGFEWGFFSGTLSTIQTTYYATPGSKKIKNMPCIRVHCIKIRDLGLVFNFSTS